jgi:hypothetical protein
VGAGLDLSKTLTWGLRWGLHQPPHQYLRKFLVFNFYNTKMKLGKIYILNARGGEVTVTIYIFKIYSGNI